MYEVFAWGASVFSVVKTVAELAAYLLVILSCIKYLRK